MSVAASMVMVAIIPRRLMAPRMVMIFQCPPGVDSWIRPPPSERAYSLVIDVVTSLSSRNIRCSGATVRILATNCWRHLRLASVSRSVAWSDFFSDADPASAPDTKPVPG